MDAIQKSLLPYHDKSRANEPSSTEPMQPDGEHDGNREAVRIDKTIFAVAEDIACRCYEILAVSLTECGCLRSAYDFAKRGSAAFPHNNSFGTHLIRIEEQYRILKSRPKSQRPVAEHIQPVDQEISFDPLTDLQEEGSVRREIYAWNNHEPDRSSASNLSELNKRLAKVAPKCEVRAVSLPVLNSKPPEKGQHANPQESRLVEPTINEQLGLFATEDIRSFEKVLEERSLLTTNNRLHDTLCDACSALLPDISHSMLRYCDGCQDTVFCSETCASLAQELYHPAICGKADFDLLTKDPSPTASASSLYLALLGRTFAMAETQNTHPLNLPETRYLWGDFTPPSSKDSVLRRLPFTFHDNISAPLQMLERMDVDIFTSQLSETWVINTLFAKFRGTASARLSTSGSKARGPEVAAVHPLWCLANHSCAPNVKWDWAADINFEARGGDDVVRWGRDPELCHGGIQKGEEILSHYCDVDLPVKERREWAVGALGGNCLCKRCTWENQQEEEKKQAKHQVADEPTG